jgi:Phosphotransferase enzyme family
LVTIAAYRARSRFDAAVNSVVARHVGEPAVLEELRHRPGQRLTLRARGPLGTAIVKLYQSDRIVGVAARIAALATGPPEPVVPEVLAVEPERRLLVLSDVPGRPLREAILESGERGEGECRRAGAAIAAWHQEWAGRVAPGALVAHTIEGELIVLADRSALASGDVRQRVAAALPSLRGAWPVTTVVHRGLDEEQVLLGERVGLIDVDDAALGPPELDIGKLLGHLDLIELRSGMQLSSARSAFLEGYTGLATFDWSLLERCRTLARLHLACIHDDPRLLELDPTRVAVRT